MYFTIYISAYFDLYRSMHVCRSPMLEAEDDEPQDMQLDGINNYNRKGKGQYLQKLKKIVQI
jgi:hypothetical protein